MIKLTKNPFFLIVPITIVIWLFMIIKEGEFNNFEPLIIPIILGTITLAAIIHLGIKLAILIMRKAHNKLQVSRAILSTVLIIFIFVLQIITTENPLNKFIQKILPTWTESLPQIIYYIFVLLFAYAIFPKDWKINKSKKI